jgi:YrbI family 3-deoxy-D-manno-octulosonate 8-phosphate phosphatase
MYYGECGDELKRFNTLDGKAFELLRERGLRTGIVTAERTRLVADRAAKVGADHLFQGVADKLAVVEQLCAREGLALGEVAYVGDDLGDLELLRAVGFSACPSTAVDAVKAVVHRVCARGGGEGCVREVADEILRLAASASSPEPDVAVVAAALA